MNGVKASGKSFHATSCTVTTDLLGWINGNADASIISTSVFLVIISNEILIWVQNLGNRITRRWKFLGRVRNQSCGEVRKYKTYSSSRDSVSQILDPDK